MRTTICALFLVLCALPCRAAEPQEFEAAVISIHDGDTMRVRRIGDDKFFKLRLFAIDAPEIAQVAGVESRDALRALVGENTIEVRTTGATTYGRHVARIYVDENYVNEAQVVDGWAWHYSNYTEGEPEHESFAEAEEDARNDGAGLWTYPDPIPPWVFRQMVQDGDFEPVGPLAIQSSVAQPSLAVRRAAPLDPTPRAVDGVVASAAPSHFAFGKPVPFDNRHRFTPPGSDDEVGGITELKRIAFSLGHYDRYRVPAWVAMKWTEEDYDQSEEVSFSRPPWKKDTDLPAYARGDGLLDYAHTTFQKGHMARDADVEAWGIDAVREATRLSNAVPQKEFANHAVWGLLEDQHRHIVEEDEDDFDITTVWVISGPVFYEGQDVEWVNTTAIPHATYKVLGWFSGEDEFRVRGYIIGQDDSSTHLPSYLRPIDQIEAATGFDFFPGLDDESEEDLEAEEHSSLWE